MQFKNLFICFAFQNKVNYLELLANCAIYTTVEYLSKCNVTTSPLTLFGRIRHQTDLLVKTWFDWFELYVTYMVQFIFGMSSYIYLTHFECRVLIWPWRVKDQPTGCWTAEIFAQHQVNMSTRSSSLCVVQSAAGDQTSQVIFYKKINVLQIQ